ncbi:MAG: phosphoribosylformylglycinamidine synthase subunit PurQ [Candidatus Hydrogenedentota bacterium]
MSVRALILTGFGINCDNETEYAFRLAGAAAQRMHLNDLLASPDLLEAASILAVPGGFSFGDDIASGRILANRLRYRLGEPLAQFIGEGKLVIGICNGFQVLVKMGLLPMVSAPFIQEVTLTHNDSGRFENRWVKLKADPSSVCVWTRGIDTIELPVRHGEGKFIACDAQFYDQMKASGLVALRYCNADGRLAKGEYPANPNGSIDDVAGLCDATGRVFGLMPHPEANVHRTHHPRWTREALEAEGQGLQIIRNGVAYAQAAVTAAV